MRIAVTLSDFLEQIEHILGCLQPGECRRFFGCLSGDFLLVVVDAVHGGNGLLPQHYVCCQYLSQFRTKYTMTN